MPSWFQRNVNQLEMTIFYILFQKTLNFLEFSANFEQVEPEAVHEKASIVRTLSWTISRGIFTRKLRPQGPQQRLGQSDESAQFTDAT